MQISFSQRNLPICSGMFTPGYCTASEWYIHHYFANVVQSEKILPFWIIRMTCTFHISELIDITRRDKMNVLASTDGNISEASMNLGQIQWTTWVMGWKWKCSELDFINPTHGLSSPLISVESLDFPSELTPDSAENLSVGSIRKGPGLCLSFGFTLCWIVVGWSCVTTFVPHRLQSDVSVQFVRKMTFLLTAVSYYSTLSRQERPGLEFDTTQRPENHTI